MRIAAAPADLEGCGTYRILLPYRRLRARGHNVSILVRPNDPRIAQADILVVQRQSDPAIFELVKVCRARGIPVVYELDDNLHDLSPTNPASRWYGEGKPATNMVERFLSEVDALTVSTQALADEYQRFNANIFLCPNALEDGHVELVAPKEISGELKREDQVRIGWAGSFTHRADLLTVVPALVEVMRADERVRFVTIGDCFTDMFPEELRSRVEWLFGARTSPSLDPDRMIDDLLGLVGFYRIALASEFDIAIAPLEQTVFNRCKSDLKVKEYGIFGVPTVASRFGPYALYETQAEEPSILLARDTSEWVSALTRLINSPRSRGRLARANLEHVKRHHLLSRGIERWEYALTTVAVHRATECGQLWALSSPAQPALQSTSRAPRLEGPLLVNDAGLLGDALSALPVIYRLAHDCSSRGITLKVMLAHPEVASLISPDVLSHIRVLPWCEDKGLQEAIPASRLIRLSVLGCLMRFGPLLHMMQAHYIDAGFEHTDFTLPQLDPGLCSETVPNYDFVVSPFSRSDGDDHHKLWPLDRWQTVIDRLSQEFSVCVVASASETVTFKNAEAFYGKSLRQVAAVIANARQGVLSIDNGISHMTHLLRANHLLLYPAALAFCWVRNTNPNALHIVGQPIEIPVDAVLQAVTMMRSQMSKVAA